MQIDVSPLAAALASLERAAQRSRQEPEDEEVRDAVIQRFEYTIDLCWKFMQRVLKHAAVPETAIRTKKDLFRESARLGLLDDPELWFRFLESRNETSHICKREVAERVHAEALRFVAPARIFADRLEAFVRA
ncbi:MAG: nucleotidyltransferase [Deltaproteobacteria bacterium]|nr:nucleotidyltransferase [Deltaproteobacteria bacterium]